jgi:hypothetical protein
MIFLTVVTARDRHLSLMVSNCLVSSALIGKSKLIFLMFNHQIFVYFRVALSLTVILSLCTIREIGFLIFLTAFLVSLTGNCTAREILKSGP